MFDRNKTNHLTGLLLIFLCSILILLPQFFSGNLILGSDSIFHFNRFYDTAEQIKNVNFNYHISLYGFQQSGRIVNALYGPFIAYFHGFLVLISKNWFIYQVLSNIVLFNLAGLSMYVFLIKSKMEQKYAVLGALLYISSYSIQYWTIRQGFTSWGAALMPLALSILFELKDTKQVPKYTLGIYTALMVQTHMLSSVLLVLIYLPFFALAFFQHPKKLVFIKRLFVEIGIFFGLTMNIWSSYFYLLTGNQLISPKINTSMNLNTINQNSYYWLMNPVTLIPIFLLVYFFFFRKWKDFDSGMKTWFWVMNAFLFLTTSIFPWNDLIEKRNPVAQLIQYPFRFFVPVTIILIYLALKFISTSLPFQKTRKKIFLSILVVSLIQPTVLIATAVLDWNSSDNFLRNQYKVVFTGDSDTIKSSFYDVDKQKALELVAKGTPDYLPSYGQLAEQSSSYYDAYITKVIQNQGFKKTRKKSGLTLEWQGDSTSFRELPIIVYKNTIITFNGQQLNNDLLNLSAIGTPTFQQLPNAKNSVTISYKMEVTEKVMIIFSELAWLIILIVVLLKSVFSNKGKK